MKKLIPKIILIFIIISVGIRFSIKDQFFFTAPIFYATPPLVIFFISIINSILNRKKIIWMGLNLAIGICSLIYFFKFSYIDEIRDTKQNHNLTVLLWNISSPSHPNDNLIEILIDINPDIVAIIELGNFEDKDLKTYSSKLPDYKIKKLSHGMMCMVKGEINYLGIEEFPWRSSYNKLEVKINERKYNLIIADIGPSLLNSRKEVIDSIFDYSSNLNSCIILGDFNTPFDSILFDKLKNKFNHSFSVSGHGFIETWPYGLPLLSLDHVWVSKDIRPLMTIKKHKLLSSHALIISELNDGT